MTAALEVRDLVVDFTRRGSSLRAVDHVSFALRAGETLALVGESGSGKSTVVRAVGRLLRPTAGQVLLEGEPVRRHGSLPAYRRRVQLVFQDPFASLNPAHSVGHHLARPIRIHRTVERSGVDAEVERLLASVNLSPPHEVAKRFPHELSGGQRQRVAIARAIAPDPAVLLADEPVSMLDVSIRLEILNLLDGLKRQRNLALLYVTHDLATARHFSTAIMVMYRGEIVEQGPADEVILHPAHPYTQLLAAAAPEPGISREQMAAAREERRRARETRGQAPSSGTAADTGCRYRSRCPLAMDACTERPPNFVTGTQTAHVARCWLHAPDIAAKADAGSARDRPSSSRRSGQ